MAFEVSQEWRLVQVSVIVVSCHLVAEKWEQLKRQTANLMHCGTAK